VQVSVKISDLFPPGEATQPGRRLSLSQPVGPSLRQPMRGAAGSLRRQQQLPLVGPRPHDGAAAHAGSAPSSWTLPPGPADAAAASQPVMMSLRLRKLLGSNTAVPGISSWLAGASATDRQAFDRLTGSDRGDSGGASPSRSSPLVSLTDIP
jgi:hypothetical protein